MSEQPLHALTQANQTRAHRHQLKQDLKALGSQKAPAYLAALLDSPPSWMERMPVGQVLAWLPRWGDTRAEALLVGLGVPPGACVAGEVSTRCPSVLSHRQRRLVARVLREGQAREAA